MLPLCVPIAAAQRHTLARSHCLLRRVRYVGACRRIDYFKYILFYTLCKLPLNRAARYIYSYYKIIYKSENERRNSYNTLSVENNKPFIPKDNCFGPLIFTVAIVFYKNCYINMLNIYYNNRST